MHYDRQGFVSAEDGTRLFYGIRGQGPSLVLNDGIGCDGFAWKYLQPDLAKNHQVIHWHYRGHGRSGAPADTARLDIPTLTRDLSRVLAEVDAQDAVLFGHSMGTQVALEFYRQFPERARGLVLICGTYGKVTETFHGTDVLKNVLPRLIEYAQDHQGLARALWGRVPSRLAFRLARLSGEIDGLTIREEDFRMYWDHINLIAWDVFLPMLRLAGEHTAEDILEDIHVPTLIVAAEKDTFTPKELAHEMADRIPASDYLLLAGASHASPVEQPEAILKRLRSFLPDLEAKA